ncbi:MAG: hypothetical protein APF84_12255 [Gracilibacter sp. BRH_c7a]|nr:MAG: hypothetical protein APF84_12255 [Gracilibacter sp. BRH_c7a]
MSNYIKRSLHKYCQNKIEEISDVIAREFPVTIFINEREIVTLVCSPQYLRELAVGFLLSEGLIKKYVDITSMEIQEEGLINIKLAAFPIALNSFLRRNIASCCGKGRAGLYFINDARQVKGIISNHLFEGSKLSKLMEEMETKSEGFQLTGGIHASALGGEVIFCMSEDIGRHNAVDKAIGAALISDIDLQDKALLLSGRVSSEIVIKAARAGIPLVLSRAAPTDLAIDLAEDLNITTIGFARKGKLNIYSHSERII